MKLFSFFAAACCIFVFSCAVCACTDETNIESNWTLTSLITPDGKFSAEKGNLTVPLTLFVCAKNCEVSQNVKSKPSRLYHISGFSGINRYNGKLSFNGYTVKIQLTECAKTEGPADKMELERLFCNVLQKGGNFSISKNASGSELVIYNLREKTELTFKKSVLENTNWKLKQYNSSHTLLQAPKTIRYASLGFTDANRLYGNTGTNNFSATCFIKNSNSLSISELAVTRIASANGEAYEFERRYMELLKQCVLFTIEGSSLTLKSGSGEALLTYTQF